MSQPSNAKRVIRDAHLQWVPIPLMRVSVIAQREKVSPSRVDHIASNFDPEQLAALTVNGRDDVYYLLDGMHRVEALKAVGWGDQQIQCWTYKELTDAEMSEVFLKLNNVLPVNAFDQFRIGVHAGRPVECDIGRVVALKDSHFQRQGAVRNMRKIYTRGGTLGGGKVWPPPPTGDAGLEAPVIDGLALLCQRYNGQLERWVKLTNARGGVTALLHLAHRYRLDTGTRSRTAFAAVINSGRTGRKLPSWSTDKANRMSVVGHRMTGTASPSSPGWPP